MYLLLILFVLLSDDYIHFLSSQENTTVSENATHYEDTMGQTSESNTVNGGTNITSTTVEGEPGVLSSHNETDNIDGGSSIYEPDEPGGIDVLELETTTVTLTPTPPYGEETHNDTQPEETTWGEGSPVIGPEGDVHIRTMPGEEEEGAGYREGTGEEGDGQEVVGHVDYEGQNGEEEKELTEGDQDREEVEGRSENTWEVPAVEGQPGVVATESTLVASSTGITDPMDPVHPFTVPTNVIRTDSHTTMLSTTESTTPPTTFSSTITPLPSTISSDSLPVNSQSNTTAPSTSPTFSPTVTSSVPSTLIPPVPTSNTPTSTTHLPHPHPHQHPHPHPPSSNSSYNVVEIPAVTVKETKPKESGHAPNGSVVVLQSADGLNGAFFPPVVYIAVTIATVVIVVALVCALYVVVLRDKPRHGSQIGPSSGSSTSAFYLSDTMYNCNGDVRSGNANAESTTMTTVSEYSPRTGASDLSPVLCNGGKVSLGIGTEPPLTTSTPVGGGKHGFAYQNPAFSSDNGSLSDNSDVDIKEKSKNVYSDEKSNGGYLVPVRQLPPPTPPKPRSQPGVSDNVANEIRRYGRLGIPVCHKVSSGDNTEDEAKVTLPLCRVGSNDTHTYEEIPAHLGGDTPNDDLTTTSHVTPMDISEDTEVITGDDASVDLVTFMTDYIKKSRSITDPATPKQGKRFKMSDPNATYDRADMFTPATPSGGEYAQTLLVAPPRNANLNHSLITHSSGEYEEAVEVVVSPSEPGMNCKPPTPSYAEPIKRRVREMTGGARGDSRRSSSYENIYDTVTPSDGQQDEDLETEGENSKGFDTTSSDVMGSDITTPSPSRRRILYSPDVVTPDFIGCEVIDLSDEANDTTQLTNGDILVPNGHGTVGTSGEEEPKYLSLVMEDGWEGSGWVGGKPPLPTSPPPSESHMETEA